MAIQNTAAAKTLSAKGLAGNLDPAHVWLSVFPLAAAGLFVAMPSFGAVSIAGALVSLAMLGFAAVAIHGERAASTVQTVISACAPVQFACFTWLAVAIARAGCNVFALEGGWHFAGTIALALVLLAAMLVLEALVSAALLVMSETGAVRGVSLACLVSAKYAGALGRIG